MSTFFKSGEKNLSGERIYQTRKAMKLSQENLAAMMREYGVDIDRMAISSMENRERAVTDYELVALSKIFGVTLGWLVGQES